jgi:hypothetical protein
MTSHLEKGQQQGLDSPPHLSWELEPPLPQVMMSPLTYYSLAVLMFL